jgi:hypothetical protein
VRRAELTACVAVLLGGAWLAAAQAPPGSEAPATQPAAGHRRVTVRAEGYNRDDALKQALRRALEQGAGVELSSRSQAENFTLVRDTIYSRALGIVSEYRVLREGPGDGAYTIELEALVNPQAVNAAWHEVQNVLDQIGRPRIMVWIDETIDDVAQADSVVAARIEQMFAKVGFDLVSRTAVEELRRREGEAARTEQDAAKLAALAKDAGAHLLISGRANAHRAGHERLHGQVPAAFYNCDVQAQVYYADTGRLLASESLPSTRAGVRTQKEYSPQAARSALVQATFPDASIPGAPPPLARRLFEAVLEQWATQITSAGPIELEVNGLDFRGFTALRNALRELREAGPGKIESVDADFGSGIGKFRIRATITADTLAERLLEVPFCDWLEVVDLKRGRIQAKAVRK